MTKQFTAVCLQLATGHAMNKKQMKKNLNYLCDMIDWAVDQYSLHTSMGVKLLVGPELGIYGFPSLSLKKLYEKNAIEIPGEETDRLVEKAKMYKCYIVPGSFVEKDPEIFKLIFNTQVLVGPKGVLHRYRKYNPWWAHEPSVSPHDLLPAGYDTKKYPLFPVTKTEIGNIGGWICYDAGFPEVARELAYNGCEIFAGSTAWMEPYDSPPLSQWHTCCKARSIESMAYGVYTGSGASVSTLSSYPPSGNSFICDYEGRVLAQTGYGEQITCSTLDIDALRNHRKNARLNNFLAMSRFEGYNYYKNTVWKPQAQLKTKKELTVVEADEITAKNNERFWSKYYGEKVKFPRWRPPQWPK